LILFGIEKDRGFYDSDTRVFLNMSRDDRLLRKVMVLSISHLLIINIPETLH